jgi:hypothetical protein
LSVYLRTIQNDAPRCFFFDLIRIDSERAENLKEKIVDLFKAAGLEEVMKKNLVGFASDGASVMTGRTGGLGVLLGQHYQRKLYRIHCAPHKLQLALGHVYSKEGLKFLKNSLENTCNNLYSFYNRNAVKRKSTLRNTAEALDLPLYELNYIFPIRWATSEYTALERVNRNYITILSNLESIKASEDFDQETKLLATNLLTNLLNTHFKAWLLFVMDVLGLFKEASQRLQNTAGTLIGMETFREYLLDSLEKLKTNDGAALTTFLATYRCYKDVGRLVRCKAKDLDDKDFVLTEQFTLKPSDGRGGGRNRIPKLTEHRNAFIDALKEQILRYFPQGSLAMFDVLEPSRLPGESGSVHSYAAKIIGLAQWFEVDPAATAEEFSFLLHSLIDDNKQELCVHSRDDPVVFWSHFLSKPTVVWHENIRKVIESALALPVATADVERGFSILKHIAYDRRSRLTPAHLRNLLFLRINGPDQDQFDPIRYAKAWVACGGMRSDDPRQQRKKQKNELPRSSLF